MPTNTKIVLALLATIALNTTCLTAMKIAPAPVATQDEHKAAEMEMEEIAIDTNTATDDKKDARVILILPNVIKLSPPSQRNRTDGMAAPQRQEMKEPRIIWIDEKVFKQYQDRFSLLFETVGTLPKELINIIVTYEDEEFYERCKKDGLPADEVEIKPAVPTCKVQLCKCLCHHCRGCDEVMSEQHRRIICQNNNGGPFSCDSNCCVCCGCIGYCRTPCRYCAACAEMPYDRTDWRWVHDPEAVWQWYRDNCCQCPVPGTMPNP